ncbi:MAG TPA: T9SS type A sorting domain-containing protein, partial [Segetibacter sp.]|nr:T9SS type A sorting domain-containing protein [Segetibacter sp.]
DTTTFSRFCSADLPPVSAFYNNISGLGTQERIFINGEENGMEGRAVGHIITGANAGTSYQLPYLGKFAWENSVASPTESDKTVVAGMDDGPGGQVYFYVGTKTNAGTEIDKAGLNNGKLYGVSVTGLAKEDTLSIPAAGTRFSLIDLDSVQNMTGATLDSISIAAGVTTFLRPEDGAWDPSNPQDFYFNTTDAFALPSRLWRLRFDNPASPESGGTIEAVLDGTEGQKMLDNMAIDKYGHILLQEDVGNNAHLGKIWQYTIATDELVAIAQHDSTRFLAGGTNFLTQDEESSGIIDAESILGPGMFLMVNQSHYKDSIHPGIVEGGQLLALRNPDSYGSALPLHLLSFTGELKDGKTELNWNTADEVNTKHFEIERSGNGRGFTRIAIIGAEGKGSNRYNAIDTKPQTGNNYYRLKMVDKDGKFTYSQVILIIISSRSEFDFVMYPNPATSELRIISADDNATFKVNIYNQQGQKVTGKPIVPASGVISVKHLPKGLYLLQVISDKGFKVKKLIKR